MLQCPAASKLLASKQDTAALLLCALALAGEGHSHRQSGVVSRQWLRPFSHELRNLPSRLEQWTPYAVARVGNGMLVSGCLQRHGLVRHSHSPERAKGAPCPSDDFAARSSP